MHIAASTRRRWILCAVWCCVLAGAPPAVAAVAKRPDLLMVSVSKPPASVVAGAAFEVTDTVRNAGRVKARKSVTAYFLSADARRSAGDVRLGGRRTVKALKRRKRSKGRVTLTVPGATTGGAYRLIGCADGAAKVREAKERNNCRAAPGMVIVRRPTTPSPAPRPNPTPGPSPGPGPTPGTSEAPAPGPTDPVAAEPATVAPPLDRTQATPLADAMEFLYTGADPIQKGVAPGTIDDRRVAVLRGTVRVRAGAALAGVRVRVLDHPELGRTATQADGGFDIAVNGGGSLTLVFERAGYIPVQRLVAETPWQDYRPVDDVVMIPYQDTATEIDLAAATTTQVARSDPVTDGDGTRRSTLLFEPGTAAVMELPGGGTVPLGQITVRSTEYTIGPSGRDAMPGQLPPTSGYTYAAELSIDEAVSAGATGVSFSRPVVDYVENFLGFPAGTAVPTGRYDRETGRWVGGPDGRVVRIVAEAAGAAQLDVDGDGVADTGAKLSALGIDAAELAQLASLYNAGASLWRVQLTHFSPVDYNWPFGPGPLAQVPRTLNLVFGDGTDCIPVGGTGLGCDTQTVEESAAVQGTDLSLEYDSERMPGRTAEYSVEVPASDATPPPGLKGILVEVEVGGETIRQELPPQANQSATLQWDGSDSYGRVLYGEVPARVRLGYEYDAEYQQPAQFASSWARVSGVPVVADAARQSVTLFTETSTKLGTIDPRGAGLGGWSLSEHHAYDPVGRVLALGDGRRIEADAQGVGALERISAAVSDPHGVAVGPDGSVYAADTGHERVRRVAANGTATTVAGTGTFGVSGDGGPATTARLASPEDVAVTPGGDLLIADTRSNRIRSVDPAGVIRTVAGGGSPADGLGDGGPAVAARLAGPTGVAAAADGTIYIADRAHHRVRMVTPDGAITTVAGDGVPGLGGDGGPASQARLDAPGDVAVTPEGALYVADTGNDRVRRVGADGIVNTVAGGGPPAPDLGDEGPATVATLRTPAALAVAADGALYVADRGNNRVRKVEPGGRIATVAGGGGFAASGDTATDVVLGAPAGVAVGPDGTLHFSERISDDLSAVRATLPGFGSDDLLIPSEDGARIYRFTRFGRHLSTLDALTGAPLWAFAYDAAGRLASVTDQGGRITTIERTAAGLPTAIVAPGGQRTGLSVGAGGFLASIANTAGDKVDLGYGPGGLLTSIAAPQDGDSAFGYDALGRVVSESDPDGGERTLHRDLLEDGHRVSVTASDGEAWTYRFQALANGGTRRTVTDGADARTVTTRGPDGSTAVERPDGMVQRTEIGADPRFGLAAPLVTRVDDTAPGGLERTVSHFRTVDLVDPANPLSVDEYTDFVSLDGRTATQHYGGATRTLTRTSPEGRTSTTVFDARGRIVRVTPAAGVDPIQTTFDGAGRITRIAQGAAFWDYGYDARDRMITRTNAAGATVAFEYDEVDRITKVTLPSGQFYRYAYDASGNRTAIVTPAGTTHRFAATAGGLRTGYTPAGATSPFTRTYDAEHQLLRTTPPSGRQVQYARDPQHRPSGTADPDLTTTLAYVGATERTAEIATAAAAGPPQTIGYQYDGSLLTDAAFAGPAAGSFHYEYSDDLLGSSMTLASGADEVTAAIARDDDGLPTTIGPFTIARNGPGGAPTSYTAGAVATELAYDGSGALASRRGVAGGVEAHRVQITRGVDGSIARRVETVGGASTTWDYTYDGEGRLTRVARNGAVAETYAYDVNGNRTSRNVGAVPESQTYDAQDRLTAIAGVAYGYDADGMLSARGGDTFHYGPRGELLSATVGGVTVTYRYDGQGRRVARTQAGQTTQYLYGNPDNVFEVTAVREPTGQLTLLHYDDGGLLHALERGPTRYLVATDQAGTPRVVAAPDGSVVRRIDSDAFGVVLADTDPSFSLPIGFGGGIADPLTGLVRMGLRDYDPRAGRFTARDPILFEGGALNLYAYAGSDPVTFRDPSGLACVEAKYFVVVGGAVKACIDDTGWSYCLAPGGGLGGSVSFDPAAGRDKDSISVQKEIGAGYGPSGLSYSSSTPVICGGERSESVSLKLGWASAKIRNGKSDVVVSKSLVDFKHQIGDFNAGASGSLTFKVCKGTAW